MQLFHGTRQRFDKFDVAYKGTGESGNIDAGLRIILKEPAIMRYLKTEIPDCHWFAGVN